MQLNSTSIPINSLQRRIGPALKRSHSATATSLKADNLNLADRSAKLRRVEGAPGEGSRISSRESERAPSEMPSTSKRGGGKTSSIRGRVARDGRPPRGGRTGGPSRAGNASKGSQSDSLSGPFLDEEHIKRQNVGIDTSSNPLSGEWRTNPKSALSNFMLTTIGKPPEYVMKEERLNGKRIYRYLSQFHGTVDDRTYYCFRANVSVADEVFGVGDGMTRRDAEKTAALSANYAIIKSGLVRHHYFSFCDNLLTHWTRRK